MKNLCLPLFRILKYGSAMISLVFLGAALFLFLSIRADERQLDQAVEHRLKSPPHSQEFVEELTHWVYNNQGFAKNQSYFLFRKLGPTPLQVLHSGGDCSDKSRLLSALLRRFDMDSTLVMLHACASCEPTHTVVDIRHNNWSMAADPVFDIVFPTGDGSYYGLDVLQRFPMLLTARLDFLTHQRGSTDKIAYYPGNSESYSWPKTINWDKNIILRQIAKGIRLAGYNPYLIGRPHFLEDPKLFLFYVSLSLGGVMGLGYMLLLRVVRTHGQKCPHD